MAPPHLHPRSRMTSSLFATTIFASFLVVALPHLLPCPAPRRVYADGEMPHPSSDPSAAAAMRRQRRRMRKLEAEAEAAAAAEEGRMVEFRPGQGESSVGGKKSKARECPVPKPGGMLGEWLGFHKEEGGGGHGGEGKGR